jgi:mono/diheme cytochrome c family protein
MNAAVKLGTFLFVLFFGLAFLLQDFSPVAGQEKGDKQYPPAFSAEQRVQAKTTFKDKCSRCHGTDGKGNTVLGDMLFPPDFTDDKWWKDVTDERLLQSITNGKDEMPPFGMKLSRPEILTLIAYLRCFDKSSTPDEGKAKCD